MNEVLSAPYRIDRNKALELYLKDSADDVQFAIKRFLEELLLKLEQVNRHNFVMNYPSIKISSEILKLNTQVRKFLINDVKCLLEDPNLSEDTIKKFIDTNHRHIKWALNEWILLNAGCCIEVCHLSKVCPQIVKDELKNQNIDEDSLFIHNHVIRPYESEVLVDKGVKLGEIGFKEEYFRESRLISTKIIKDSKVIKAVISEGSWIYDPKLHNLVNGKPFVRFGFLADDSIVGSRFFVKKLVEGDVQFKFALESSKTRKSLYDKSIFKPESWGLIYQKNDLLKEFNS